jgi:hypothetical protein
MPAAALAAMPVSVRLVSPQSVYVRKNGHYSREVLTEVRKIFPGRVLPGLRAVTEGRAAALERLEELRSRPAAMKARVRGVHSRACTARRNPRLGRSGQLARAG